MLRNSLQLDDFNFDLPSHLIARYPLAIRSASRLLAVQNQQFSSHSFDQITQFLEKGDLLIFNDTKVIPARLMGQKRTGGKVEVLVERILDESRLLAQLRVSKAPAIGDVLYFDQSICLEIIGREQQFYELKYHHATQTVLQAIEAIGHIPLPPYMHRLAEESDKERYQTIYAKHKGSVAAPTAGFHFDAELLQKLHTQGINFGYLTLHIGAGTFTPIRSNLIQEHKMHAEYLDVSHQLCAQILETKANKKRIIAVGTTSMRALETVASHGEFKPYRGETDMFIYPGFKFRCVDALITNLHLPRSSLLLLVCAFGGHDLIMQAYHTAIKENYRFYSYGDAMWIEKSK